MQAVIFDIDGTIADCTHRLHYISESTSDKQWDAFHRAVVDDKPIEPVISLIHLLQHKYDILFVTGRNESSRLDTLDWILRYVGSVPFVLYMRGDSDRRPDTEVKRDIYMRRIRDVWDVKLIFEDRARVVKMWRELGLTCLQVADGNY